MGFILANTAGLKYNPFAGVSAVMLPIITKSPCFFPSLSALPFACSGLIDFQVHLAPTPNGSTFLVR